VEEIKRRDERLLAVGYDYHARERRPVGPCNLCGALARTCVTERDRYGLPARAVRCDRCSLVFLDPMLTPAEYADFYERWYRPLVSAFHGRQIDATTLPDDQRRYADSLVDWLAPLLSEAPPRRLLDVGGSTGIVAVALRDHFDLQATVLDPSPDELAVAARAGLRTAAGFVEDFTPAPGERYDLITVCQTADHLLDLQGTLSHLRGLLSPEGRLFIDIVDFLAVARRHGRLQTAIKLDHPYSLSDATLRCFLARAGLSVEATRPAADEHIAYLCRRGAATPDALPAPEAIASVVREWPAATGDG
jgi:SAM-dependent methyltransferase